MERQCYPHPNTIIALSLFVQDDMAYSSHVTKRSAWGVFLLSVTDHRQHRPPSSSHLRTRRFQKLSWCAAVSCFGPLFPVMSRQLDLGRRQPYAGRWYWQQLKEPSHFLSASLHVQTSDIKKGLYKIFLHIVLLQWPLKWPFLCTTNLNRDLCFLNYSHGMSHLCN